MKNSLPLRYSLPLMLGLLGLLLVLLAFFDGLKRTEQHIETEASAQLLTFGTRLTTELERLAADRNSAGMQRLLLRSASEPHLRAATLVDAQGYVIESTHLDRIGKRLDGLVSQESMTDLHAALQSGRATQHLENERASLIATFPFARPPERGQLRSNRYVALYLESDLTQSKRLNWARHVERAWLMGAVIAAVMAVLWSYFYFAVTQRLARLTAAMQRVAAGDLAESGTGVSGRDELGRLGAGFVEMRRELRQRRNQLSASEARYRAIVNSMSEGLITVGADGRVVTVNEAAGRIAGMSSDEIHTHTPFQSRGDLLLEDGSPLTADKSPIVKALRERRSIRDATVAMRRRDGEMRWLAISCEPLRLEADEEQGGEAGLLVIVEDITERRLAEVQSRRDSERFSAIVGSAMDAVICADGAFRITVFNAAAERMFGHSAAEMRGQDMDRLLAPHLRADQQQRLQRLASADPVDGTVFGAEELVGLRADGEEFPIEASLSRVLIGGEVMLTAIIRDISDRKRAEQQREQLEAQLHQSQKLQSLGTLTGGIAHDFNNILTAITGNAKLARTELSETAAPDLPAVRRSLGEIEKASTRATELVRQVLTFSRRQNAERIAVDMTGVVAEAVKFLRPILPAMIEIRTHLPRGLPQVAVDATQIHQVITNLISNAAHAIGERAGVIEVGLEAVDFTHSADNVSPELQKSRYLRLSVVDNGCGMDAATRERIFEPFFTTKNLGQGTGLGLSVVHGIVKNHDGAVLVQSTPGAGSRFDIFLPIVAAVATSATTKPSTAPVPLGGGRRIVYLDDEEALVFLTVRMLERLGYIAHGFSDSQQAIEYIVGHAEIDALVSDLAMPGQSGFDVVRKVKAARPDLPVVLVSGYLRPQDVELARQLGVRKLLLKPDTVDGLAAALHELLGEQPSVNAV